ncbi:hypothetical protein [Aeromonas fluvialis]|nr:hypothetical protein [Aeromonas fluvialis]
MSPPVGPRLEDVSSNLHHTAGWQVTFKSQGASGFPLFENGSLFADLLM